MNWSDFGCILKINLTGFACGLDIYYSMSGKNRVKGESEIFELSSLKNRDTIFLDRRTAGQQVWRGNQD